MKVEILGSVQDGGVPHLGCDCDICEAARKDARKQKYVASILLKEDGDEDTIRYLIDATPDIRNQIKGDFLDGVFLAHHDIGQSTGLVFFGEEGLDADRVSVYCNSEVEDSLMKNDPFRLLLDRGNIEIHNFEEGDSEKLQGGEIKAHNVYHPQVNHNTTGFIIEGPEKTLYYLSDITSWTDEIIEKIKNADIAIIDGTFWSRDEIDRYDEVPHPTIKDSMEQFSDFDTDIHFTHLNHTNPALRKDSQERKELEDNGFGVVEKGQEIEI